MNLKNLFKNKYNRSLIIILFISFLINILWMFSFPNVNLLDKTTDEAGYYNNATEILKGNFFSKEMYANNKSLLSVGYPLYISFIRLLFGDNLIPIKISQIFLVLIGAYLLFKIGDLLFNKRIGVIAAGIYSLYPTILNYSHKILTETIFIFLLILSIYFFCKYIKLDNIYSLIFSGFLLAIATIVRQITLLFPIVIVSILLIDEGISRKKLMHSFVFLISFLAVIVFFTLRNNYVKDDSVQVVMSLSGMIYVGNNLETNGTWMGKDYYEKLYKELGVNENISKRRKLLHKMAIENIKDNLKNHPWEYFKLLFIKKPLHMWAKTNVVGFGFPNRRFKDDIKQKDYFVIIVKTISAFLFAGLLVFALIGFFYILKSTWKDKLIFISIPLYFTAVLIPILAIQRYVVPTYPFIFVLSAVGIDKIFRKR